MKKNIYGGVYFIPETFISILKGQGLDLHYMFSKLTGLPYYITLADSSSMDETTTQSKDDIRLRIKNDLSKISKYDLIRFNKFNSILRNVIFDHSGMDLLSNVLDELQYECVQKVEIDSDYIINSLLDKNEIVDNKPYEITIVDNNILIIVKIGFSNLLLKNEIENLYEDILSNLYLLNGNKVFNNYIFRKYLVS